MRDRRARAPSRTASSSFPRLSEGGGSLATRSARADERLRRWLEALSRRRADLHSRSRPRPGGCTSRTASRGVELVRAFRGPDRRRRVGRRARRASRSLRRFPSRDVTLLEANGRKVAFLERAAAEFPNVRVVRGRAEEQEPDVYGVAVAKALAPPPVAVEWCLPLVRPGGAAVLWVGPTPSSSDARARAPARWRPSCRRRVRGLRSSCASSAPTPPGFPRRPGWRGNVRLAG